MFQNLPSWWARKILPQVCISENHFVQLNAHTYLEQDAAFNPTGKILKASNTKYDFSFLKKVNTNWDKSNGYDQSFIIENYDGNMQFAATCNDDNKKLQFEHITTSRDFFYPNQTNFYSILFLLSNKSVYHP